MKKLKKKDEILKNEKNSQILKIEKNQVIFQKQNFQGKNFKNQKS